MTINFKSRFMAEHHPLKMLSWNIDDLFEDMRYTLFTIEMLVEAMSRRKRQYGPSADLYEQFCVVYPRA